MLRRIELHLLGVQFKRDQLWSKLAGIESVSIKPEETNLADDTLVFANFSESKHVINIADAVNDLPIILHNLSLRLFKLISKEKEFEKWKDSLAYQSSVLSERAEAIELREKQLDERETIIKLREVYLTKENAILDEYST